MSENFSDLSSQVKDHDRRLADNIKQHAEFQQGMQVLVNTTMKIEVAIERLVEQMGDMKKVIENQASMEKKMIEFAYTKEEVIKAIAELNTRTQTLEKRQTETGCYPLRSLQTWQKKMDENISKIVWGVFGSLGLAILGLVIK